MTRYLETAGEIVAVDAAPSWVADLIEESAPDEVVEETTRRATVVIEVERTREPFPDGGWEHVTRGAYRCAGGALLTDVLSTGFDLLVRVEDDAVRCVYRYRPPLRSRALAAVRARFVLLVRCALVQYPALWAAGRRGRAPLHAVPLLAGETAVLLAGAAGVGKSTLVGRELDSGGAASSDNLCTGDGIRTWGLAEPRRSERAEGRRTTRGRRETALEHRLRMLEPEAIVVVRRRQSGPPRGPAPIAAAVACRALVSGTYMAGELRRYWAFAATLAACTGIGAPHPPVTEVSAAFAQRLPSFEIELGDMPPPLLSVQLQRSEVMM